MKIESEPMKIEYSKESLKFLAKAEKGLVLAWDSDYTKVTPKEREQLEEAEKSGFVPENEIDWDNLSKYAE